MFNDNHLFDHILEQEYGGGFELRGKNIEKFVL